MRDETSVEARSASRDAAREMGEEGSDVPTQVGERVLYVDPALYSGPLHAGNLSRDCRPLMTLIFMSVVALLRGFPGTEAPSPAPVNGVLCVADGGAELVERMCPEAPSQTERKSNRVRIALGRGLCWTSASVEHLEQISGVGPATAGLLVAYRDAGGAATRGGLQSVRGVGPATAQRVLEALDSGCVR